MKRIPVAKDFCILSDLSSLLVVVLEAVRSHEDSTCSRVTIVYVMSDTKIEKRPLHTKGTVRRISDTYVYITYLKNNKRKMLYTC